MPVRGNRWSMFENSRESSTKRTVVLGDRHTLFLDGIAVEARLRHRIWIARSEIVYAVIEAAIRSGIDFSEASSEHEITMLMLRGAGGRTNARLHKKSFAPINRKQ